MLLLLTFQKSKHGNKAVCRGVWIFQELNNNKKMRQDLCQQCIRGTGNRQQKFQFELFDTDRWWYLKSYYRSCFEFQSCVMWLREKVDFVSRIVVFQGRKLTCGTLTLFAVSLMMRQSWEKKWRTALTTAKTRWSRKLVAIVKTSNVITFLEHGLRCEWVSSFLKIRRKRIMEKASAVWNEKKNSSKDALAKKIWQRL